MAPFNSFRYLLFWTPFGIELSMVPAYYQCDQIVRLFFNIWPFGTMKISPIISQICQSSLSTLPNKKKPVKILTTWWYFAKSGHTACYLPAYLVHALRFFINEFDGFSFLLTATTYFLRLYNRMSDLRSKRQLCTRGHIDLYGPLSQTTKFLSSWKNVFWKGQFFSAT